jgi:hypothetical protein
MATERASAGVTVREFEEAMFELDGATEYANWLIFGDSGCGKTVLASSLPGRVLYLAGEPGYIAAARWARESAGLPPIARGSKVRLIPDTATAVAACAWLEDGGATKFDWVVPDGLSTMNSKFLLGYAAEAFDRNPKARAHRNLPDRPDYYNTQNFTKSWVARLIDLPVNVLFTAHAMRPEGDEGERLVYPSIQGKGTEVSNYVSGLMHVVGYMATRVVRKKGAEARQQRRILFQHYYDGDTDTRYFAKDQFTALGFAQTIRDSDNPDGVMMPDLLAMVGETEPKPPAPVRRRATRGRTTAR